jgi:hypothetical protein
VSVSSLQGLLDLARSLFSGWHSRVVLKELSGPVQLSDFGFYPSGYSSGAIVFVV